MTAEKDEKDDRPAPRSRPAPIGKGDTPNVAGSDVQQPEIAEGPVEGLQPGERVERGPWTPPVEVDPPPGYGHPPAGPGREKDEGREKDKGRESVETGKGVEGEEGEGGA